jgi:hypothetical protein
MEIVKLQGISFFVCGLLNLIFTFLIWRGMRKDKARLHLGFAAFFSALYSLWMGIGYFFWSLFTQELRVLDARLDWIGIMILPAFVVFSYYFTEDLKYIKLKISILYLSGLLLVALAFFTPLVIKNVFQGAVPPLSAEEFERGPLEPIGRLYILLCLILGLINLFRYYFKISGLKKVQTKYFILGTAICALGNLITTSLIPLIFKTMASVSTGIYFYIFWFGLSSYAIFKHRLLDIRVVVGRMAIYFFTILTEIALIFSLIFLNIQLSSPFSTNFILIAASIILALTFHPIFRFFEKIAGKYLYYTVYNLQIAVSDLTKRLNQTIELDKLTDLINRSLLDALKLDRIGIVLREPEKKQFLPQQLIKFEKEEILSLLAKEDYFLSQYLKKIKSPLVREEIPFLIEREIEEEEKRKLNLLKEEMEKMEIGLFLPLFVEEELIGMIILGNKLSGEAYTVQDLDLLTPLASQSAIALNNALSYAEIEKRKIELEKFYQLTVGRELKMIELKKRIKELEEKLKGREN